MGVRQTHCERSERATENPENGSGRKFYILWIWVPLSIDFLKHLEKDDKSSGLSQQAATSGRISTGGGRLTDLPASRDHIQLINLHSPALLGSLFNSLSSHQIFTLVVWAFLESCVRVYVCASFEINQLKRTGENDFGQV